MRTYTFPDHRPPGVGPWSDEPDKAQWIDDATGLDCLIVRARHSGALCGYVGVPPGHPWHGRGYDDVDADVHGGLTFSDSCQEGAEDGPGVCHVPEPGRPAEVWWLGFDCAHAFDLRPTMEAHMPPELQSNRTERSEWRSVYRDFAYVRQQVTELAAQVDAASRHNASLTVDSAGSPDAVIRAGCREDGFTIIVDPT